MDKFIIEKSLPLHGSLKIEGSKNSALPIMAATLLADEPCALHNIPALQDVSVMQMLLSQLGAQVTPGESGQSLFAHAHGIHCFEASLDIVRQIRASFLVAGPMLARFGKIKIPYPGGCPIGVRPVDLHLKGFKALGVTIKQEHGAIELRGKSLVGADIYLDYKSVGATENIMMCSVLAKGVTRIENCAIEPEIIDLANFLNKMGAKISGAGTESIHIEGVDALHGCTHEVIPDRIEAGTYMIAAAITKGDVTITNIMLEHLKPITAKLREINVNCDESENSIRVYVDRPLKSTDIMTMPHPGFPTDMQAPIMSLLATIHGTSIVNETVFENRFLHVAELNRMGADIKTESRSAIVKGVKRLTGAQVCAKDLRAGAALVLSALAAEGTTELSETAHIERGYARLPEKLSALGATIRKA